MKQLQPVLWSKGTFLTPQHLQLQDKFLEDSLNFRLQALTFCAWGFTELVLDEGLVAKGQLAIVRASGMFPDGLIFEIPGPDQAPASKALAEFFDPGDRTLDIYLTVPDYKDKGLNVTGLGLTAGSRYLAEMTGVRDDNVGTEEKTVQVQVARKNLRLLTANESREGNSELQIATIEKKDGVFRLDSHFVPPLLEVKASKSLLSLVNKLVELLSGKSSQLSALRRQKKEGLAEFAKTDTANFWLLYTVNSTIPLLNDLLSDLDSEDIQKQRCHPHKLFSTLTALGASLTTFSETIRPQDLPSYDHLKLGPQFAKLDETLRSLLNTVVPTDVVTLPLTLQRETIYATVVDQDKYFANTRMFLAIASKSGEDNLIRKVPNLVKTGSGAQVELVLNKAVPGILLTHVPKEKLIIPRKMGYQYFSLNQSGEAWESMIRARNFAAHVPGEIQSPEMELIILLPRAN